MEFCNRDINFLNDDRFIEWRLLRTDELERYWSDYIREYPEYIDAMNEAIRKFSAVKFNDDRLSETMRERLYCKIMDDMRSRKARKRRIQYWSTAACAALLVSFVAALLITGRLQPAHQYPAVAEAFIGQMMPSDEIQLISGDEVIELGQNAQIVLGSDGKASLIEAASSSERVLAENTLNRLIVPYGKRTSLHLADGTKVWVNSGTELEFPSKFDSQTRSITVKGEIYIEVAKLEHQPFCVNTDRFTVKVYGTSFNISAYPGNDEKTVVLVDGSIGIDGAAHGHTKLVPGEMYSETLSDAVKTKVNPDEYTSWKDGILMFNKTPISEVLKKIGRYYNINFEDHSGVQLFAKSCTGKLLLSDNFDEVMNSVSVLSSTAYNKENGIVYIRNN